LTHETWQAAEQMLDWDDIRYFLAVAREGCETRKTKRVRLLMEFLSRMLSGYAPLLAGGAATSD
jgi:hypothetical protein